jgi:predicted RNase H-like nuclease (RuvC/YqgF family)
MLKHLCSFLAVVTIAASLTGCATRGEDKAAVVPEAVVEAEPVTPRSPADIQKITDLERQLAREQRQYQTEKRRLEQALRESQKQNDELQKKLDDLQRKLDALLAIDRDLRNRSRNR